MTVRLLARPVFVVLVLVALALALGACGGESTTRVQLTIDRGDAEVDDYQLRIASPTITRSARADVIPAVTLVLPDEMGGTSTTIEVWGLQVGAQRAYGKVTFTPRLRETVAVTVSLTMVSCELWCEPGSTACESDGIVTCEQDDGGCFVRGAPQPCPAEAPFCSNGTCAATCSDECTDGESSCDSAVAVRECGDFDSDPCLDWSVPMACPSGQTCSAGQCTMTTTCSDGADCDDGNACTTDDTCSGGACSGTPACTDAPPHATPTCGAGGTCSFTCDVGFVKAGASCNFVTPAPMPTPRDGLVVVAAGGKIYAIGGYKRDSATVATNEAYDPATNTWETRAPMPTPRENAAGVLGPDGRIYVIGGTRLNEATASHVRQAAVQAYDPVTNTWLSRTSLPSAREELAAALGSDGRIYVFGGRGTGGSPISTVSAYDPVMDTWISRAPLSGPRYYLRAATVGDRIYVMGGHTGSVSLSTVEIYDPALNAWSPGASMITARSGFASAVGADGKIYVFGGYESSTEAYDPVGDAWTTRADIPTERVHLGAARGPNEMIYVIGGHDGEDESPIVEAFDPLTNMWP